MPLIDAWRHTGGKLTGFFGPDEEIVPWQNEFEFTTAIIMLTPDFIKNRMPIVKELRTLADSPTFLTIVTHTPLLWKEFADKIKKDKDIDDIVKAFVLSTRKLSQEQLLARELLTLSTNYFFILKLTLWKQKLLSSDVSYLSSMLLLWATRNVWCGWLWFPQCQKNYF